MKRLFALLALCSSVPQALAGHGDDQALKVLVKALGAQRDVRATLIQVRSDGEQSITVNVQIAPRQGITAKVTMPLIYAGMTSFDNGQVWKNYDPQLDVLRIEPSPSKFQLDTGFRKSLIEKNYSVSLEREALVAGRRTAVVFLKPKATGVASRRLYIDAENSLILRYIVTDVEGKSVTTVDTKSVDFETAIDVARFEKIGEGASKTEKSWGPIQVAKPADAKRYAGFVPVVPSALPVGLALQAIHVVGTAQRSFVGVRLTDGMAVVTVYLWKPNEGEKAADEPFKGIYDSRGSGGIRSRVVGDVSDNTRGLLARLFVQAYEGQTAQGGTEGGLKNVQDRQTSGGGTGIDRPKLVIDNESSE